MNESHHEPHHQSYFDYHLESWAPADSKGGGLKKATHNKKKPPHTEEKVPIKVESAPHTEEVLIRRRNNLPSPHRRTFFYVPVGRGGASAHSCPPPLAGAQALNPTINPTLNFIPVR